MAPNHSGPARDGARTAAAADEAIRINLLAATVTRGGQTIRLIGRILELAYGIALRDRPVPRETLIAGIWPEAGDDAAAENAFNLCLHRLRGRLGRRDAISLTPYGYTLGANVTTDLRAFEDAHALLTTSDAPRAEAIEAAAAAYRQLGVAAVPVRIEERPAGGIFDRKITYLKHRFARQFAQLSSHVEHSRTALAIAQELIRHDGCDESAWEIVIRAHLAHNDRNAAVNGYRTYARNVALELGLEPSDPIKRLIAQSGEKGDRCALAASDA